MPGTPSLKFREFRSANECIIVKKSRTLGEELALIANPLPDGRTS